MNQESPDAPDAKQLVKRLDAARQHCGLTVREWSTRAGLSENYASTFRSRVVRGRVNIEMKSIQALARAAGVSLEWLLYGRGTMLEPSLPPGDADLRFPNRGIAILVAGRMNVPDEAIAKVRALEPVSDLPVSEWVRQLEAAANELKLGLKQNAHG